MQVSAICTNVITAFGNTDIPAPDSGVLTQEASSNSFTSLYKKTDAQVELLNKINEWQSFCHKQIKANNIDYIA